MSSIINHAETENESKKHDLEYFKYPLIAHLNPFLCPNEKILFGMMYGLKDKSFKASNEYIAKQLRVTTHNSVTKMLKNLEDCGYIYRLVRTTKRERFSKKRTIYINKKCLSVYGPIVKYYNSQQGKSLMAEDMSVFLDNIDTMYYFAIKNNFKNFNLKKTKFNPKPIVKKIGICKDLLIDFEKIGKNSFDKNEEIIEINDTYEDHEKTSNHSLKRGSPLLEEGFTTPEGLIRTIDINNSNINNSGNNKLLRNLNMGFCQNPIFDSDKNFENGIDNETTNQSSIIENNIDDNKKIETPFDNIQPDKYEVKRYTSSFVRRRAKIKKQTIESPIIENDQPKRNFKVNNPPIVSKPDPKHKKQQIDRLQLPDDDPDEEYGYMTSREFYDTFNMTKQQMDEKYNQVELSNQTLNENVAKTIKEFGRKKTNKTTKEDYEDWLGEKVNYQIELSNNQIDKKQDMQSSINNSVVASDSQDDTKNKKVMPSYKESKKALTSALKRERKQIKEKQKETRQNKLTTKLKKLQNTDVKKTKLPELINNWNELPTTTAHRKNTKLYASIIEKLCHLIDGDFIKHYKIDDQWLDNNPRVEEFLSKKWDFDDLMTAMDESSKFSINGYWPPEKNSWTKNLDTIIYNKNSNKSMFLLAFAYPPKLESKTGNKVFGTNDLRVKNAFESLKNFYQDDMQWVNKQKAIEMVSAFVEYFHNTMGRYNTVYSTKDGDCTLIYKKEMNEYLRYIYDNYDDIKEFQGDNIKELFPGGYIFSGFLNKINFFLKLESERKYAIKNGYIDPEDEQELEETIA
jgi:hypothetical protein